MTKSRLTIDKLYNITLQLRYVCFQNIISQKHVKMQLVASTNSFQWGPGKLNHPKQLVNLFV